MVRSTTIRAPWTGAGDITLLVGCIGVSLLPVRYLETWPQTSAGASFTSYLVDNVQSGINDAADVLRQIWYRCHHFEE